MTIIFSYCQFYKHKPNHLLIDINYLINEHSYSNPNPDQFHLCTHKLQHTGVHTNRIGQIFHFNFHVLTRHQLSWIMCPWKHIKIHCSHWPMSTMAFQFQSIVHYNLPLGVIFTCISFWLNVTTTRCKHIYTIWKVVWLYMHICLRALLSYIKLHIKQSCRIVSIYLIQLAHRSNGVYLFFIFDQIVLQKIPSTWSVDDDELIFRYL